MVLQIGRLACIISIATGLFCASLPIVQAATLPDAFGAIDRIVAENDLQGELPEGHLDDGHSANDPLSRALPNPPDRATETEAPLSDVKGAGDVMTALLWLLAGLGAFVLLFRLLNALQQRRGMLAAKRKQPVTTGTDLPATTPPPPMDEADRLAAEGNFDQAIRVLFLRCINAAYTRRGPGVGSTTAREILALFTGSTGVHDVLKVIVAAEEFTHFGGRSANRQLYDRCRESHDIFLHLISARPGDEGTAA